MRVAKIGYSHFFQQNLPHYVRKSGYLKQISIKPLHFIRLLSITGPTQCLQIILYCLATF